MEQEKRSCSCECACDFRIDDYAADESTCGACLDNCDGEV